MWRGCWLIYEKIKKKKKRSEMSEGHLCNDDKSKLQLTVYDMSSSTQF